MKTKSSLKKAVANMNAIRDAMRKQVKEEQEKRKKAKS